MRDFSRQDGFTLAELMVSMTITLLLLGAATTTFKNALALNDSGTQLADSNQNLRAGTNMLIRDLLQAGRAIPVGGIPIPSGPGAQPIHRPSPPGQVYYFDNTTQTTLPAITSGWALGPMVTNQTTDMITMIMVDPFLPPVTLAAGALAADGSNVTLGAGSTWIAGDVANGVYPIKAGDLVWFNSGGGAIQTVTSTDATKAYFAANDWFNFNQRNAGQGTVMELQAGGAWPPSMKIYRLLMFTYYVDAITVPGSPRLTRVQNDFTPQALAGIVEDVGISYDLVDGVTNPANVSSLPYTLNGLTYTSNQIRKVNLHIGVRSEQMSMQRSGDFIRNHLSTSVSIRDLATINRYQ